MGTTMKGDHCASLVLTLRSLPVKAALQAFGNRLADELQKLAGGGDCHSGGGGGGGGLIHYYSVQLRNDVFLEVMRDYAHHDGKGSYHHRHPTTVQLHFTVIPDLAEKLEPQVHLPFVELARNRLLVLQAKWYERQLQKEARIKLKEDVDALIPGRPFSGQLIKSDHPESSFQCRAAEEENEQEAQERLPALIRLLTDMVRRFSSHLSPLNHWMVVVLAHYCLMESPLPPPPPPQPPSAPFSTKQKPLKGRKHISLGVALKRLLQLLSAGILLPYSRGISDPVDPLRGNLKSQTGRPLHVRLSLVSQERVTRAAQTLLRVMTLEGGGLNYLLGTQPLPFGVVFPSDTEGDDDDEKDEEDEDESGHSSGQVKGRKSRNSGVLSSVTEWRGGVTVTPGKSVLKKGQLKGDHAKAGCGDDDDDDNDDDDDDDYDKKEDKGDFFKGSFPESSKSSGGSGHHLEERQYSPVDHPDDYYLAVFNLNQSTAFATTASKF